MHIIQVCKTIFSAGFHGAKAPSSICLQYRLYTNTQKVYESIPFISLNFSSPPSVAGTASSHPVGISRLSGLRRYTGYL